MASNGFDMELTHLALSALDVDIADFMYRVAYLGPQRAVAQRFYRRTDAAVEEVDARGENLAFLTSLSPAEWESLQAFTKRFLGFEPYVRIEGMNVEESSSRSPAGSTSRTSPTWASAMPRCSRSAPRSGRAA